MRPIGPRIAAAAATLLGLIAASATTARGDKIVETVYGSPVTYYAPTEYLTTSRLFGASDTYFAPSSYAYLAPARYATTGYSYAPTGYATSGYVPTTYATTTYRRPGLLRRLASRPIYETTYRYAYDPFPTTTYQPTTISYDPTYATTGYATTGYAMANPCGYTSAPFEPPPPSNSAATTAAPETITNRPKSEPTLDDSAHRAVEAAKAKAAQEPLPAAPLDFPPNDAAGAGGLAPTDEPPAKPAGGSVDRTSYKPKLKEVSPRAAGSSLATLHGEVVSAVTRDPKAKVQVIFTDRRGRFDDRAKTTDEKGAFDIFLPDGSWSYRVVDPADPDSAKEYPAITVTSGRYLDETDTPVYGLRLNY